MSLVFGQDTCMSFERLVGTLDYPMYIVTAAAGGERDGCLVGFATQASIDPARFLVCLSDKNRTYRVARDAEALGVHLLAADQEELAELFGGETGDEVDKLDRVAWRPGPGGAPVLEDCANWFAGRVLERIPFGDHVGFLLEPVEAHAGDPDQEQLTFHRARRIDPGHDA
jgi:flavin reductase (DIM6/NTAB) family NADH-FMN oxidoreductase RutF